MFNKIKKKFNAKYLVDYFVYNQRWKLLKKNSDQFNDLTFIEIIFRQTGFPSKAIFIAQLTDVLLVSNFQSHFLDVLKTTTLERWKA